MISDIPPSLSNDYRALLVSKEHLDLEGLIGHLLNEMPNLWVNSYRDSSKRKDDICIIPHGSFEYIFDDYCNLENKGLVVPDSVSDSRVIAAFGRSSPQRTKRDDYRLRGWIGRTELFFGKAWDKGHFIAHSLGGAVDGLEINVFQQRRDVNRGWSEKGKIFRKMENYCFENPGTFFFNRPIYGDPGSKPSFIEFGILKSDRELWVEVFDNR
jgi:hypothetical protein